MMRREMGLHGVRIFHLYYNTFFSGGISRRIRSGSMSKDPGMGKNFVDLVYPKTFVMTAELDR